MKLRNLLLAAAFTASASLGLASQSNAQDGELELLKPGVVSCAFTGSFPPFAFQNADGEWDGLSIRVYREIANRLDLEIDYVITKWESLLVGLIANNYDMLCGTMDITKERQERVLFVDGWAESGARILVHEDSDIESAEDVKGKQMGVLVGSTFAEMAKPLEPANTKYYQAESDAIQDLANKQFDVMVTDSIAAAWSIEKSGLPLKLLPGYISRVQKGWATTKERVNLVKAFNAALEEMHADGTYDELTSDLIGYSPAPENPIRSIDD